MRYDILIVGSGIAGSSVALALRRVGLSVCVIERDTHPRFAIGESTVPSTTLGFDYLARTYGIPEFHEICHYTGLKKLGLTGFPKQHFYFAHHTEGEPLRSNEELMYETLELPIGPDVHMLRADVDGYLVSRFPAYGVDYLERTDVKDFARTKDGVTLTVEGPEGRRELHGRLVVDASGHASFFAHRYGLRDPEPRLTTHTRSIFGHFKGIPPLDDVLGKPNPAFRFRRHGGTQHHCFDGGWIWVIPFDNGTISVGAQLDPVRFPVNEALSPEEELRALVARFPTVQAHLGRMEPVRRVIRTSRIQFTSRTIIGDGFILTPHAAGFIDPLFSTGITLTQSFVSRFVPLAARALRGEKLDMEVFRPVERVFQLEVETIDKIVSGTMRSWGHFDTFKQYWRLWGYATILQYTARMVGDHSRADGCTLMFGAAIDSWRELVRRAHALLFSRPHGDEALARELKALIDTWPHPHNHANYEIASPRACNVGIIDTPYYFNWLRWLVFEHEAMRRDRSIFRLMGWGKRLATRSARMRWRYRFGGESARGLRTAVDRIHALKLASKRSTARATAEAVQPQA
jgi:FADH2 O2-dependent halogenase